MGPDGTREKREHKENGVLEGQERDVKKRVGLTETTVSLRRSASARDLCTSLYTIPKTTTVFSAALDAADALLSALSL